MDHGCGHGAADRYHGRSACGLLWRLARLCIDAVCRLDHHGAGDSNIDCSQLALVLGILSGFGATTIVIKSQALSVKVKPFIEAARVAGGGHAHIITRHMVPNLMPIALLYMMFIVTTAIFAEAILSFLGLTEIQMSWGLMINTTQVLGYILRFDTWWLLFPASLSITLLCAAFYLVGRAMDEVVNPRLRER